MSHTYKLRQPLVSLCHEDKLISYLDQIMDRINNNPWRKPEDIIRVHNCFGDDADWLFNVDLDERDIVQISIKVNLCTNIRFPPSKRALAWSVIQFIAYDEFCQ